MGNGPSKGHASSGVGGGADSEGAMELRREQSTRHTGQLPTLTPSHTSPQGEVSPRLQAGPQPSTLPCRDIYLAHFGRCVGAEHAPFNGGPRGAAVQHLRLHLPALLQMLWETPALTHLSTTELLHLCDTAGALPCWQPGTATQQELHQGASQASPLAQPGPERGLAEVDVTAMGTGPLPALSKPGQP